jgi:SAM-dependent methyltransferase
VSGAPDYRSIVAHYEACLERHGDTNLGVDWPNPDDVDTRHRVMLDVMARPPSAGGVRLLDFGCGASHLYEYILREEIADVKYAGLDLSARFVELSRSKFPDNRYWCLDILADDEIADLPPFDYAIASGVFTEKLGLSFDEMLAFFKRAVERLFALVDRGIAFNVMSKHVDWERADLFHLPFDVLADWLTADVSRNFVFRNDYGLYEYTTYVYR